MKRVSEHLKNIFIKFKQPKQKEINNFLSLAQKCAVSIEDLNGLSADIETFSILDKFLENKRVVYLGEEDHWIHEKSDYRLMMIRYLVSRGWRYIGEELGWSDGIRIDKYIETGEDSYLERIATYGYKGALRSDRNDIPVGIFKNSFENYPVHEFKSEQLRLTRALRNISNEYKTNSERLHFFGFDIDTVAGGGYEDVEDLLFPLKDEPSIKEILGLLKRNLNENLDEEICRLNKVLSAINILEADLKKLLHDRQVEILKEHILTLRQSFEFNKIIIPAKKYDEVNDAMASREKVIHRHVKHVLSQMKPDDKLILMGHNRHLSKEFGAIKNAAGVPPSGCKVPSVGTYINQLVPEQVFSIWELHSEGCGSQPYNGLTQSYVKMPGSLNAILSEIGTNFLLLTDGFELFERDMDIVGLYNVVFRTQLKKQADAVFYINTVSPMKG